VVHTEGVGAGGFSKTKTLKEIYSIKLNLEFPEGWEEGDIGKNPYHGGGMDIFWNLTYCISKENT